MDLNYLSGKKILILGFGREGRDTFSFLRKSFPKQILGVSDKLKTPFVKYGRDKKVRWHTGKNYLRAINHYDVVIKSPGIPIHLPEVQKAFGENKITSQTEIFFRNCPGKIVGVTGTKGKSTTSSLIYQILKKGGVRTHLLGNIGKPALSPLLRAREDDVFVYELSSHQLYGLKQSPHVAVILNIYPEHLDYYKSFAEYGRAKANITRYQSKNDFLVYNAGNSLVKKIAKTSMAKKIPFQGKYYAADIKAARIVGEVFKIPARTISKSIKQFKYLPHRLEFIGVYRGIKFYNDSLSTVPETTMAALDFLGRDVETLILGGFDRGLNFQNLAKKISRSNVKTLILFPTTGKRILEEILKLRKSPKLKYFFVDNMKEAVELARLRTSNGKICLLSPASPSFGIFKDYRERGNLFKKYVRMKQ